MKRLILLCLALLCGCTHYVVEDTCRLQIGNDTENYTVTKFSVISEDREITWISDDILAGEKSNVEERDFVGLFKVRLQMEGATKIDTVFEQRFDGGSTFLQIVEKKGSVEIHKR